MKDERKKKDQLIKELKELRQRVIGLEASDVDRNLSVQQKRGELFEAIVDNTLDTIIVTDTKGYIIEINKAFEELLGYTKKEAIGKHMSEYALPSEGTYESTEGTQVRIDRGYLDKITTAVSEFAKNEKIYNWDVYFLRKDKKLVPVEQNAIFLYDERGEKTAAVSIARDITQRKKAEKAIRELKDHLENIIESSLDSIVVSDSNGYITRVNKAFLDLVGYREKEIIGRHIVDFTPTEKGTYQSATGEMVKIDQEFFDCARKTIETLLNEGEVTSWETYFLHKDGRVVPVERSLVCLDVKDGGDGSAVGIGKDITERKIKEKEIEEAKEFLENVFRTSADGLLVLDTKGCITVVNEAMEKMSGYSRDELTGRYVADLFSGEMDYEEEGTRVQKTLMEEDSLRGIEYSWLKKDGGLFDVEINASLLKDSKGNMKGVVASIRDVTDRKKAEEILKKSEAKYHSLIEHASDAIISANRSGKIIGFNKKAEEMFGYSFEEVLGKSVASLTPASSNEKERDVLERISNNLSADVMGKIREGKGLKKDGQEFPLEASFYSLHMQGEDIYTSVIRDITERKQKEKELGESIEKYRTLMDTANDAIFVADAETGIITDANKKAEELSGIPVEDIIGMHQTQFHPKEDADYYRTIFEDDIQKGKGIIRGDIFIYHKNGHKIPVEISASVAKVGGKNIIQGIFRDMRDYKRTEEELIQTRDYLENIIEGSSDCIVVVDSNASIVKVNKSFLELLGYKEEEVIGRNMVAFPPKTKGTYESTGGELIEINERFISNFEETNKKLLKEGKVNNWDTYFVRNDKKIVSVELNIDVLFNSAKEPIGAVGIVRDITKRRSAERTIKELMERYRNLVEHANDAIISTNIDGEIIVFNKKAEEIFGYTREEILNKSVALLSIPSERKNVMKGIEEYKGSDKVSMVAKIIEGKGLKKSGKRFSVETSFVALKIGGEYIFTGITRDISERKKVEKKLVDYQSRLKSLTSQMTLTEEQDRRRFAEYLHDHIGQKLFSLNLKLEEIRNLSSNNNCAGILDNSFSIIKQLINDTRSLTFELSPPILYQLGLGPALEWLTEQTREEYGIKVAFEDDEQEKELSDDIKVLLFQAVRELLINVAKHAKTQNAKVSIKRDDKHLRVCVEDDGVGFTPSYGEGFRTADGGFGLFSIRERLDFLGGKFNIESESGRGTRIIMVAPLMAS